jgi:S-adenosylmethionine:tRNA ribosyltransferase-isomerase
MHKVPQIKISDFDYTLADERIAKFPLEQRDSSKLLYYDDGLVVDHEFKQLASLLDSNSRLIFNNTKVIRARLHFEKETGAKIEIFCLEPHSPNDYVLSFDARESCEWSCMIGNARKWKAGKLNKNLTIDGQAFTMSAEKLEGSNASPIIKFSWDNPNFSFAEIIEALGELPIPPYLNRKTEKSDLLRYQTIYSKIKGSVAAPTAGLHFTDSVFADIKYKNIDVEEVTLHVGAGTFKPVKSEIVNEHDMHTEHFIVQKTTIENLLDDKTNIPVGTTSVRTLESLFWLAVKLEKSLLADAWHVEQWDAYEIETELSRSQALELLLNYLKENKLEHIEASTEIMIVPGYQFKMSDKMITNFHQPKSTLLLLISAFIGGDWKNLYQHALDNNYRFLSYGDSSLLVRK